VFRLPIRELVRPELQHLRRFVVQRNHAAGAGLGLALADADGSALEVDDLPTQQTKLRVPHARVEREQDGGQQRIAIDCLHIRRANAFHRPMSGLCHALH
jgi:hypothetical protein